MIAITGATGALGGEVARLLADLSPRLVVRDPSRAPDVGGDVRQASYDDRAAAEAALDGVTTLLLVSAAESATRREQHRTMVEAAVAAGVRHVVYTSFVGASPTCTFTLGRDHFATEEHLRASGMATTFLRDSFYLDVLPLFAGEEGVLRGPAGEGRVAAVAREDVARVAAAVLADPAEHVGATYDLTGPEALTLAEAAVVIGEHQGRAVRFEDETIEEAYASRRAWEAPQWMYDAWVSTYTAIAAGELAEVTDHVERLTGRPPMDLAAVLAAG